MSIEMSRLIDNTYIRTTETGFLCYADKAMEKGDIVMECVIPAELVTSNTFFMRFSRWAWKDDGDNSFEDEFIPLGNVLMVDTVDMNHEPNIKWSVSKEERLVRGHAIKKILKDEKLMYKYDDHKYKPEELS